MNKLHSEDGFQDITEIFQRINKEIARVNEANQKLRHLIDLYDIDLVSDKPARKKGKKQ